MSNQRYLVQRPMQSNLHREERQCIVVTFKLVSPFILCISSLLKASPASESTDESLTEEHRPTTWAILPPRAETSGRTQHSPLTSLELEALPSGENQLQRATAFPTLHTPSDLSANLVCQTVLPSPSSPPLPHSLLSTPPHTQGHEFQTLSPKSLSRLSGLPPTAPDREDKQKETSHAMHTRFNLLQAQVPGLPGAWSALS
jgi:hypothetical protein